MDTITPRPISSEHHRWLRRELDDWQAEGLIDAATAGAIGERYQDAGRGHRRISLGRIMLVLGGAFVGVGLIWLVAANLEALPPMLRFVAVCAIWLALLSAAELASMPGGLRGAVRLMAALAFGAVVFQAAQSLQVPAYSPGLVGFWAGGALAHAYGFRALMPLVVGLAAGVVWWIWWPLWDAPSAAAAVVALGTAGVAAISLAAIHDRGLVRFGQAWRTVGAILGMVGLFVAAVPYATTDDFEWTGPLVAAAVVAAILVITALVLGQGTSRLEPVGAVAVLGVAVLMVWWDTGTDTSQVGAADWAHAAIGVLAFVAVAVALVAIGTLRDNPAITFVAMAGLVIFTTFQSFAVFAAIIQGAWLFLVLGLVFLATGVGFDRARREIAATLEDAATTGGETR